MQKKILVSMMVIGLVATLAGAGLYAYFSDTETSTGNVFTAGTLDIKLADGDEAYSDGVTATWKSPSNWAPGESVPAELRIYNDGSVDADYLLFKDQTVVPLDPGADGSDLRNAILITEFIEYRWDGSAWYVVCTNDLVAWEDWLYANHVEWDSAGNDGKLTFREFWAGYKTGTSGASDYFDVITGKEYLDGNPAVPAGGYYKIKMTFTFDPDAGNKYQGDSLSFDLLVYAHQGPKTAIPGWVP
jgi:predicted ribosomally synthesized peptide with SipW-like signal peptide